MKKLIIAGACCVLLIIGTFTLVRRHKMEKTSAPLPALTLKRVNTAVAYTGELQRTRTCNATVEAWQQAEVAPRISAPVTRVLVAEGDEVRKDAVLLKLDAHEQRITLKSAQAQLYQAQAEHAALQAELEADTLKVEFWRRELQRNRALAEAGAIPQAQADETAEQFSSVEGKLHSTQARLQAAQQGIEAVRMGMEQASIQLGYTEIRAPFAASVTQRHVDCGDMALPGKPLLTLEDISRRKLVFTLPQNEEQHLHPGQRVHILTSGAAATRTASPSELRDIRIQRIYPATDPRTRSVTLEAWGELPPSLRPGDFVPLQVNMEHYAAATLIPRSALIRSPQQKEKNLAVYMVNHGDKDRTIELKHVTLKGQNAELAAVTGLAAGTEVVTHSLMGWNTLKSGDAVEVVK